MANIRNLAEDNLEKIFTRSLASDGKLNREDFAAAQVFVRAVEAETGSAYPYRNGNLSDVEAALASAKN